MYDTIFVPVDNSDYSRSAVDMAINVGRTFGSKLVGCHVYAAQLHDYRFKQMEYTLPEKYLEEEELERQRTVHDSLISRGLELISDSYLDPVDRACADAGLELERKMMDGKHHVELIADISQSQYDLIVMGAFGLGKARDSQIGSVAERVCRACNRDFWIVRELPSDENRGRDTILVALDGSPQSFGGLMTAAELAERFDKRLELVAVYDPYLHYSVFSRIAGVLSEEAAEVFRFEDQNKLHEEIIDSGLARIYQSHLDVGRSMLLERGLRARTTLLDGKAFQKILDHARETRPWLVVVGRVGIHSADDEIGLGSTAENLLRSCPSDLFLCARQERPQLDLRAEETVRWTAQAEARMGSVPEQVRGVARTAVLRLAVEKGHTVVTSSVIDEAMDRFMPHKTAQMTHKLAQALARGHTPSTDAPGAAVCLGCGVAAADAEPVRCSVCGGTDFQLVEPRELEAAVRAEGGKDQLETLDGRRLEWTALARAALRAVADKGQRQAARARIEKTARLQRVDVVTLALARRAIEELTGRPLPTLPTQATILPESDVADAEGRRVVASDAGGNALLSHLRWTEEAARRILRVPPGFMRQRTQERAEALAAERGLDTIGIELVEEGITLGRQIMESMVGGEDTGRGGHYSRGDRSLNETGEMQAKAESRFRLPDESGD